MRENDTFFAGAEEARSESEESVFVPRLRSRAWIFFRANSVKSVGRETELSI